MPSQSELSLHRRRQYSSTLMALCTAKSIGANSVSLCTQQEVKNSAADIVQILVRHEGDNVALADNVNPDSPRRASVTNKPRHMQPCCL